MIVVVGRPSLEWPPPGAPPGRERPTVGGRASRVALAAAKVGATVQIVGSVGDDEEGDTVAIQLGRAGVGHAALLRDPAGRTLRSPDRDPRPPRLDARDVALGLSYFADFRVLVLAEPLESEAERAALEAAAYQGAAVIAIVPAPGPDAGSGESGTAGPNAAALTEAATVLEAPEEDGSRFAELVASYAVALDKGTAPAEAFQAAVRSTGWDASEG